MEPYLHDIRATRAFLKQNFDGPEVVKALRFRLETHLQDPTVDPLSAQVWPAYLELPSLLVEPFTLLDAGCMSGFLYHHLKRYFKDFSYTGVDRWPEALEVAREFAPEATFVQGDFMHDQLGGIYDYVVCSNIPFRNGEIEKTVANLIDNTRRKLIFIYPNSRIQVLESTPTGIRDTGYS